MEIKCSFEIGTIAFQSMVHLQQGSFLIYPLVPCLLAIVIILLGWLVLARLDRRYRQPLPAGMLEWQSVRQLPDTLSPALAVLLASHSYYDVGWPHFLATLLDLLNRGILIFREGETADSGRNESPQHYDIVCLKMPDLPLPHEWALLHIVFYGPDLVGQSVPSYSLKDRYRLHSKRFMQALFLLRGDQHWLDPWRLRKQQHLTWVMLVFCLLALLNVLATGLLTGHDVKYGLLLLFANWLILACIGGFYVQRFSIVKDEWWLKAWSWRQFFRYLREVCTYGSFQEGEGSEMATIYLPYAAGLGLAYDWMRQFYLPTKCSLPSWFITSASDPVQQHAAFERAMYAANIMIPKDKRRGGRMYV